MPVETMSRLCSLDWMILLIYGGLVMLLGHVAQRRQRRTVDFFLGGRALPWPLVGVSILATAFSAASLLGGPGEAYQNGLLWVQLQFGDLLAILLVCWIFLPFYQNLRLTTAYEYLEYRFGTPARLLASLLFHLQVVFRIGILVYGPALALSTITGISVQLAIVGIGLVAILYTMSGGITAVVWTDFLQLVVVLLGVGLTLIILGRSIPGGWSAGLELAREAGRLKLVDPGQPFISVRSMAGAVLGYGILSLSVAGTNQQPVQRYLSCRNLSSARRAAILGWGIGLAVTIITLMLGVMLFAYFRVHPGELSSGSGETVAPDAIFPFFIAHNLPAGVAGLLVAAIFAAAMSSLDSALNSLATASVVDFYRPHLRQDRPDEHYLKTARWFTLVWGILGILAGLYVAGRGSLLAMAVRYMGYFAGPMLGLFLLGMFNRRANGAGAVGGMAVAFLGIVLWVQAPAWLGSWPSGGIWICAGGCGITLLAGSLLSYFWPPPPSSRLRGLCRTHEEA